jgi:outer membrane protein
MKKLILIVALFFTYSVNSYAADVHFIDFKKVLNQSKSGAGAQTKLKNKFQSETKKFNKLENDIRKEEAEIISQKKVLKPEEYRKKVSELRKKVANLQKNKQTSFNNIAKSRNDAKKALLTALNPIIKKYMETNKIEIVIDKQMVVLGSTTLDITDQIIATLNKEAPSLKIN